MTNSEELERLLAAARVRSANANASANVNFANDIAAERLARQRYWLEPVYNIFDMLHTRGFHVRANTGEAKLIPNGAHFREINARSSHVISMRVAVSPYVDIVIRPVSEDSFTMCRILWGKPEKETNHTTENLASDLLALLVEYEVTGEPRNRRSSSSPTTPAPAPAPAYTPLPDFQRRRTRSFMFDDNQSESPED